MYELLFAQVTPPNFDLPGAFAQGGTAAVCIGAIIWLLSQHRATLEKITATFDATLARKDQEMTQMGQRFATTVEAFSARVEGLIREAREEHRSFAAQQFALHKEIITVLERLSSRIDNLDRSNHDREEHK